MDGLLIPTLLNQQKLSNEKRRRSVSLPLSRPGYNYEQKVAVKSRKGVHFPVSILLQQAITEGDMTEINQLISEHGNKVVMELEPSGLPPVMRSVFEGQVEALKLLVENGAELSTQDPEGWNVLHVDDMPLQWTTSRQLDMCCTAATTISHRSATWTVSAQWTLLRVLTWLSYCWFTLVWGLVETVHCNCLNCARQISSSFWISYVSPELISIGSRSPFILTCLRAAKAPLTNAFNIAQYIDAHSSHLQFRNVVPWRDTANQVGILIM